MNERDDKNGNFWGLLRIVGNMHEERRKQELAAELEAERKPEPPKKPKKRKKRKSKSK